MPHTHTTPGQRVPVALFLTPPDTNPARPPAGWGGLPVQHLGLLIRRHARLGDLVATLDNDPTIAAIAAHLHRLPANLTGHPQRIRATTGRPARRAGQGIGLLLVPPAAWARFASLVEAVDALNSWRRLLRPGGFLVTVLPVRAAGWYVPSLRTDVIAAGRAAGLGYHQHIPAITAPSPTAAQPPLSTQGRHRPAHRDVILFAAITTEATDA
jgi:hypothetical protein